MSIDWQAPGMRRWLWIAAGVVVCWVVGGALCARRERNPLPEKVAERVERHAEASAIDASEIHRLQHVAAQAQVREQAAIAKARQADTVAAPCVSAPVMDVELPRVQALTAASAEKDTALVWARVEAVSLDSALVRSEARAAQADSVLDVVIKVAEAREEPCKVLWVVPCPSRKLVMVATAVLTIAAVAKR